jgi:hypothetical protein
LTSASSSLQHPSLRDVSLAFAGPPRGQRGATRPPVRGLSNAGSPSIDSRVWDRGSQSECQWKTQGERIRGRRPPSDGGGPNHQLFRETHARPFITIPVNKNPRPTPVKAINAHSIFRRLRRRCAHPSPSGGEGIPSTALSRAFVS